MKVWDRIDTELTRKRKNWAWLAAKLEYSEQRLNNWKRRGVPPSQFSAIADALGRSLSWVARGIEDDATEPGEHESDPSNRSKRPSSVSNEAQVETLNSQETGKKPHLFPVTPQPHVVKALNWEQLMDTILKEGLGFLKAGVWVEIGDDANGDELLPGDQVFLQSGVDPIAQDYVLVAVPGGDYLLRKYRKITSKVFEAWAKNEGYGKLRSDTDGIEVVAVVMERKVKRRA